jgi:hypothetical protein
VREQELVEQVLVGQRLVEQVIIGNGLMELTVQVKLME